MERYSKESFSFLLRIILIPRLIRDVLCRNKATIISYHDVKAATFRKHLQYLIKDYNIISMDHLASAIKGERDWNALPKKSLVITMDDGLLGNYNLIPVLDEFKAPITIYARPCREGCTKNDKYLSREEMAELSKHSVSFGAHSMTHRHLTRICYEDVLYEIEESKRYLEQKLKVRIMHFAYPYGDCGEREIAILRDRSLFASARTVRPGWVDENSNLYELRCMGVGDDVNISKLALDVTGVFPFLRIIRSKMPTFHFNEYRGPLSYIAGFLGLRGPIAQHTRHQAELIRKYAEGKKRLVEIGVSEGGSALVALSVMDPNGKAWLIDPYISTFFPFFSLSQKIAERALRKFKDRDVVFLRDYSQNAAKRWNTKLDYLLIDGSHSEEDFMRDWHMWSRFVGNEGIILIQSTKSPSGYETGIGKAIGKLFHNPTGEWEIIDKADATLVIKRKKLTQEESAFENNI